MSTLAEAVADEYGEAALIPGYPVILRGFDKPRLRSYAPLTELRRAIIAAEFWRQRLKIRGLARLPVAKLHEELLNAYLLLNDLREKPG
jgi:hypothetical protein